MQTERNIVEVAGDDFIRRIEAGENPSIAQYEKQYPDAASEIRDFLGAIQVVHRFKGDLTTPNPISFERPTNEDGFPEIEDYKVVREIGRGGMGVVYEAHQISLDRKVALKVLPEIGRGNEKAKKRFQVEARAAAKLNHANIVPVHEVGEYGDSLYYAMQFIDGPGLNDVMIHIAERLKDSRKTPGSKNSSKAQPDNSLAELLAFSFTSESDTPVILESGDATFNIATIDSKRPVSGNETDNSFATNDITRTTAGIPSNANKDHSSFSVHSKDTRQEEETQPNAMAGSSTGVSSSAHRIYCKRVARIGVNVASALQYAHDNKVIHRDIKPANLLLDTNGTVWIADFGLAKTENSNLTRTGDIVGTLRYMSPDRFKGECDETSDIYALGMTIYEMLAFQPAFPAQDRANLIDKILNDQPTPLGEIDSRIPLDLETIVHKAMAKDADRRYASAKLLADDLQRFLDGKPILARPVGTFERIMLWSRKNKAVAALLSLLFAILIGTSIASTWGAITYRNMASVSKSDSERAQLAAERATKLSDEAKASAEKAKEEAIRANAATKLAGEEAERANAEAEAVREINEFYTLEILAKGNPEVGSLDRKTTLLSVLDNAAESVKLRFGNRPLIKGQICRTIGSTYLGLGEYDKCNEFLTESYQQLKKAVGENDLRTLETLQEIALYEKVRPYEAAVVWQSKAKNILEKVIKIRTEVLGPDDPQTLDAKFDLADLYGSGNELTGARKMEPVLKARTRVLGETHRDTLKTRVRLQRYQTRADLTKVSEEKLNETFAVVEKKLGKKDMLTIAARVNIGLWLKQIGRKNEASEIFHVSFDEAEKWLGRTHPYTIRIMDLHGHLMKANYEEMIAFQKDYVARCLEAFGDTRQVNNARRRLADAYIDAGKFDDAEKILVPMHEKLVKQHGNDQVTSRTHSKLYELFAAKGDWKNALTHAQAAYKNWMDDSNDKLDHESDDYLENLRDAQYQLSDFEAVIISSKKLLEYDKSQYGDSALEFNNTFLLSAAYEKCGEYSNAEALLRKVIQHLETKPSSDSVSSKINGAKGTLSRMLSLQKKFKEARKTAEEAIEFEGWVPGKKHNAIGAKAALGQALIGLGNFDDAEKLFLATLEQIKTEKDLGSGSRVYYRERINGLLADLYSKDETKKEKAARFRLINELKSKIDHFMPLYKVGDYEKALPVIIQGIKDIEKHKELDENLIYYKTRFEVYALLSTNELGRYKESLEIADSALKFNRWAPRKEYYKNRISALKGQALLGLGRFEEAETILAEEFEQLIKGEYPSYAIPIAKSLIELYKKTDQPEKQKMWEAKAKY